MAEEGAIDLARFRETRERVSVRAFLPEDFEDFGLSRADIDRLLSDKSQAGWRRVATVHALGELLSIGLEHRPPAELEYMFRDSDPLSAPLPNLGVSVMEAAFQSPAVLEEAKQEVIDIGGRIASFVTY